MPKFYLMGSSPDQLAQQQFGYDQFYQGSNVGNRAAYQQQQAQALEAALRQRDYEDQMRYRDDYRANANEQAALDRESRYRDVLANKAGNFDALRDRNYNEAVHASEMLPDNPAAIRALYPNLSDDQINRLALFARAGKKYQQDAKDQTESKNFLAFNTAGERASAGGNPFQSDEAISGFGISSTSPLYPKAQALVRAWQQPYTDAYKKTAGEAEVGNRVNRIGEIQGAIDESAKNQPGLGQAFANSPFQPSRGENFFRGVLPSWALGVSANNVITPTDTALARRADESNLFGDAAQKNLIKSGEIRVAPSGQLESAMTRPAWMANETSTVTNPTSAPPAMVPAAQPKQLNPIIAGQYLAKFGFDRKKAEAAAKADGYVW